MPMCFYLKNHYNSCSCCRMNEGHSPMLWTIDAHSLEVFVVVLAQSILLRRVYRVANGRSPYGNGVCWTGRNRRHSSKENREKMTVCSPNTCFSLIAVGCLWKIEFI